MRFDSLLNRRVRQNLKFSFALEIVDGFPGECIIDKTRMTHDFACAFAYAGDHLEQVLLGRGFIIEVDEEDIWSRRIELLYQFWNKPGCLFQFTRNFRKRKTNRAAIFLCQLQHATKEEGRKVGGMVMRVKVRRFFPRRPDEGLDLGAPFRFDFANLESWQVLDQRCVFEEIPILIHEDGTFSGAEIGFPVLNTRWMPIPRSGVSFR